jgi:hypothetical protein
MQTWQQGLSAESRLNKMPNLSNEIAPIQTRRIIQGRDSLIKKHYPGLGQMRYWISLGADV